MIEVTLDDALRLAVNLLRDSAESRKMPSGAQLDQAAASLHSASAGELGNLMSSVQGKEAVAFPVTLNAGFLRESMALWRDATDMKMPLHDTFKIHFMQRRQSLLEGFQKTGKAWLMMLSAMRPASTPEDLAALRHDIEAFVRWAGDGLEELRCLSSGQAD